MKKQFLLVLFSTLLSLTILELLLQLNTLFKASSIGDEQQILITENSKIRYQYKPYILWRGKPNFSSSTVFHTNSLGLRGKEFSKERSENSFRVVLLGGSAAWGYGASSNETTIGGLLESTLQERVGNNKKIEVFSFAENGYSSSQELILWNEVSQYKPDVVIQYTGYNDIYTGFSGKEAGWNHSFIRESILTSKKQEIIISLIKEELDEILSKSQLYKLLSYNLVSQKDSPNRDNFTSSKEISNYFVTNIVFSDQIATRLHIPLVVVLQPSLFTHLGEVSESEQEIINTSEAYFPGSVAYFQESYEQIFQDLSRENINFVNGNVFFNSKKGTVYFDPVHYSDKGNRIVAQELAKIIQERGYIK